MKLLKKDHPLRPFLLLWSTQSLSQLGSCITSYALTLWLYEQTGSSLRTAALTICSYVPYVLVSIFAGALTDRWDKKRTMLVCDSLAAVCTVTVLALHRGGLLAVWHLYALNAITGLMNTVQNPASEVAATLLVPQEYYQQASGLSSLTQSLISLLPPLAATALYPLVGLEGIIALDLSTFALAFCALLFAIHLPPLEAPPQAQSVMTMAKEGLAFLWKNPMIWTLILFIAAINLVSSAFSAALPGYVLPNPRGGQQVLGMVSACSGVAMLLGSLLTTQLPKPKDRVRVIYGTMLWSMMTENFLLSLSREPALWCAGQLIGWILVPVMNANLDVILRSSIPLKLQGRVYACQNTFQFFTIPIGQFLGGFLVDEVCEPFMAAHSASPRLGALFGTGKGSGAALTMLILGILGVSICLAARGRLKHYHFSQ